MSAFSHLFRSNPAIHAQALLAQFSAGAKGAARSAWIEINRPLTALGFGSQIATTAGGAALVIAALALPIGMDIKSITCIASDVDAGWNATAFTFGTLNLVNPQSGANGVNLSMFDPRLEHQDRLAPWILSKTRVDVQVAATLVNNAFGYDAATGVVAVTQPRCFHGFSLNAFQEEQVCAIQTRVEPTDRNVGVAELIHLQRQTLADGLHISLPNFTQPPIQGGAAVRAPMMPAAPMVMQQPALAQLGGGVPGYGPPR